MTMMPHSVDAERTLLGSLITYPKQMDTVFELNLKPEHFYVKNHETLYREMVTLYQQKGYLDLGLLTQFLKDSNKIDSIGGINYLAQLMSNTSTSSNVKYYSQLVMDKSQLRSLIESAHQITTLAQGSNEINEILDEAEQNILNITRDRRAGDFKSSGVVAQNVVTHLQDIASGKIKNLGVKTGYTKLDHMTRGFQPGDLIILAARPSVGKTAFALNIAAEAAFLQKDLDIAIFSLEMPAEQLMTRMLSARSMIPAHNFQTGHNMNTNNWNSLAVAVGDFKQTKIHIDDSSSTKMSDIFSKCRKLRNDANLGLVIIDYIQLINSSDFSDNRQQQVSLISRQLKQLARELNVPVIALSQLSRLSVQGTPRKPILSDIRESGSIEQDADIVMMLYREDYENRKDDESSYDPENKPPVEVIIGKHRNGPTGTVKLGFTAEINKFINIQDDFT